MNEMMHARDVLSSFLSSASASGNTSGFNVSLLAQANAPPPPPTDPNMPPPLGSDVLMASVVERHEPPHPVQAIDTMIVVGRKDESLRRAADIFKSAAHSVEKTRQSGERYWYEALRLRGQNWSLFPAPTGRPNEKTARDFRIFFGLSESMLRFLPRNVISLSVISGRGGQTESFGGVAL
jgi:mediator of RNA polymerase II transcription subunit 17